MTEDFDRILDDRARDIFEKVVDQYIQTKAPVGSRALTDRLLTKLSAASIRNTMADLEDLGLIKSPHTSAGRIPTEEGLQFFVNRFITTQQPDPELLQRLDKLKNRDAHSPEALFNSASEILSDFSRYATIVAVPKSNLTVKHIEFIRVDQRQALAVIVMSEGGAENRVFTLPSGVGEKELKEAAEFLNGHMVGKTIAQMHADIQQGIRAMEEQLGALTAKLVSESIPASEARMQTLLVRGSSSLLEDENMDDAEKRAALRHTLDELEKHEAMERILSATHKGEGTQVFIGSKNPLFPNTEISMVTAPFRTEGSTVPLGILAVIGPRYMDYREITRTVDQTAQVMSKVMGGLIAPKISTKSFA